MPLAAVNMNVQVGWALSKSGTGVQSTKQGPDFVNFAPALDLTKVTQLLRLALTLTANQVLQVDLSAFTNLVGETPAIIKAWGIMLAPVGTSVSIATGATNGLVWLAETVPAGGVLAFYQGATAKTIDATHKTIQLTAGGTAGSCDLVVLLADV